MKKILLAFFVSLFLGFGAKAQTVVTNSLMCDIEVWQLCYNQNCNFISETLYDVAASGNVVIPDCGTGLQTEFFVRYRENPTCHAAGTQVGLPCSGVSGTGIPLTLGTGMCTCTGTASIDYNLGQLDIY